MSEETDRRGESACDGTGGGTNAIRVLLTPHQLDAANADSLRAAWRNQDLYIDHLETLNKQLEGSLEKAKEVEDRVKQQYAESQHREKVLVRRLAAKEQEIQDYVSQITELKSSHASLHGRPTLLDPAVNVLILRLKQELTSTKARLEETQNELAAWKFTPDSNTGKKLMAKCRLLHQENEDLGRMTSSGRIAKLEGDLALQKSYSEEVKKSQSELDEFLQELDEDVEGMQSTVLFLQQELRASHATVNGNRPASPDKRAYSGSECSDAPLGKRRRASVLSLDYNEDEEPLTVPNGDADYQPIATQPSVATATSYEGAQVWRTPLRSTAELFIIQKLAESRAISLWTLNPGRAEFLVKRKFLARISEQLTARHINHQVIIPDVQRRIDGVKVKQELWNANTLRLGHRMNWNSYPALATIEEYYAFLRENYNAICDVVVVGETEERRPIRMVRISNRNPKNKAILIIAGQHAREWVAVTSAFYIINNITTNFKEQPVHIKNKDWYIIPIANPDGFAYTHTHDRLWRKNRRPFASCYGVDLNRNFETHWETIGVSNFDMCSNIYSGPAPFSEPESAAVRDIVLNAKKNFSAFLDIHSYGQMIMYPWFAITEPTEDKHFHKTVVKELSAAILNATGVKYKIGTAPQLLYSSSGTANDFAYAFGIPLSFAIEARDDGHDGFLLPPNKIEGTGKDILSAVRRLAKFIDEDDESD